jgi:hypothetical protein
MMRRGRSPSLGAVLAATPEVPAPAQDTVPLDVQQVLDICANARVGDVVTIFWQRAPQAETRGVVEIREMFCWRGQVVGVPDYQHQTFVSADGSCNNPLHIKWPGGLPSFPSAGTFEFPGPELLLGEVLAVHLVFTRRGDQPPIFRMRPVAAVQVDNGTGSEVAQQIQIAQQQPPLNPQLPQQQLQPPIPQPTIIQTPYGGQQVQIPQPQTAQQPSLQQQFDIMQQQQMFEMGDVAAGLTRAITNSKKHLKKLTAEIWVPNTPAREHLCLFAHVWVDKIFKEGVPAQVVATEFSLNLRAFASKVEFSKNGLAIIDQCETFFGDWIRSLRVPPVTTSEWRVGMGWLEMILLQAALARGGSEGMMTTDADLKAAFKDNVYDYVEIWQDVKPYQPKPPQRTFQQAQGQQQPQQQPQQQASRKVPPAQFFRGRGRRTF